MIYLLVRNAQDYDESDVVVYASSSKKKIEERHEKLIADHRILQRFANICKHDMELFSKDFPPPPAPNLAELPLLPLVWQDGKWNNAHVLKHDEEIREYNKKVEWFRTHLIEQLKKDYDFAPDLIPELDHIWWYNKSYTYSVQEVEGD